MALVVSSQPNKVFKLFSSKLYKITARPLDFLVQNFGPFTTPSQTAEDENDGYLLLV